MTTSDSDGPGTSTPCQKPMVANRHDVSSSVKAATSAGLGRSSWVSTRHGSRSLERLGRGPHGPPAGEQGEGAPAGGA